jgi:hypothetical protein
MSHEQQTESIVTRLVGTGVALGAAFVVQRLIDQAWKAKTGHKPPRVGSRGDAGVGEVVTAAVISGALIALARALATIGTEHFTPSSTPDLDPTD